MHVVSCSANKTPPVSRVFVTLCVDTRMQMVVFCAFKSAAAGRRPKNKPHCLTPQIACWHVLACVIAFSYRTFLQLVTLRKFSLVPLQGQKIENCNSFHGITRWTQMDVAWRATHVCSCCFRMHLDQIRPKQLAKFEHI